MKAIFIVFAVLAVVAWTAHGAVVCTGNVPTDETEYHAHPCNCGTYYICFGKEPIPMPCPKGLHWNQQKRICDLPNKANCHIHAGC